MQPRLYTNISHKLKDISMRNQQKASDVIWLSQAIRSPLLHKHWNVEPEKKKKTFRVTSLDILPMFFRTKVTSASIRDQFDSSAPPSTPVVEFQHTNPATSVARGLNFKGWASNSFLSSLPSFLFPPIYIPKKKHKHPPYLPSLSLYIYK